MIEIKAKHSANNINIYVYAKVKSLISKKNLVLKNISLQNTIIEKLVSKADGM